MTWQVVAAMTISMFIGMLLILLAVVIGGWLVYKAKTITMPSPFIQMPRKKPDKPQSYVSDLYDETPDIFDEALSPPAARLRGQKLSETEQTLRVVKGEK